MDVQEYAKYVIDNIKLAKIGSIFKITNKVMSEYNSLAFIEALYPELLRVKGQKAFNIMRALNDTKEALVCKYYKVNEQMVMDKLVLLIYKEMKK